MNKRFLVFCFLLLPVWIWAQRKGNNDERLLTAGFQFRPIIASEFLGAKEATATDQIFTCTISPKMGYSFGMIIRRGITRAISIETGINYFKRNFYMTSSDDSLRITDRSDFGIVSYEIPLQALVYVRLGERLYMNNSLGVSANWYASDVHSIGNDNRFSQYTQLHRTFLNPSLLANIGFEYRTRKAGFFYIGASLDRPFSYFATTRAMYDSNVVGKDYRLLLRLNTATLTLDLRYFFHEQPIKKSNTRKKKEQAPSR